MKKLLSLFILCFGLFMTAIVKAGGPEVLVVPDYFSGFYVGGTGAFHMAGFNGASSTNTPNPVEINQSFTESPTASLTVDQIFFPADNLISNDVNSNSFDGYAGVHGGVGKVFAHRWYTGFEGFGELGKQKTSVSNTSNFATQSQLTIATSAGSTTEIIPVTGSYVSNTTVKLTNDYGFAFRPGFLVAPRTLVYGKIGAIWANMQIFNSVNGNSSAGVNHSSGTSYDSTGTISGSSNNKDSKVSLLLGLGVEQFIYQNFITLGVEYNYANYGHVSTQTSISAVNSFAGTASVAGSMTEFSGENEVDNVGTTQASVNARISTLLGSLNFYFGSQWF